MNLSIISFNNYTILTPFWEDFWFKKLQFPKLEEMWSIQIEFMTNVRILLLF